MQKLPAIVNEAILQISRLSVGAEDRPLRSAPITARASTRAATRHECFERDLKSQRSSKVTPAASKEPECARYLCLHDRMVRRRLPY